MVSGERRRDRWIGWALAGVLACLVISEPHSAQAGSAPWHSETVVSLTSAISDQPGTQIQEFGKVYLRPRGEVVFWAKLSGREEKHSWALLSWRDGKLRTILEEGEEVASRYSADPSARYHVHMTGRWHLPLPLSNGPLLYFASSPGWRGVEMGVYGWDGERIRPILVPGQKLVVGGSEQIVWWASLGIRPPATAPSARLFFISKQPTKQSGWVLHDGERLVTDFPGEALLDGEKVTWANPARQPIALSGSEVLAVRGPDKSAALVDVTLSQVSKLVEVGQPFPLDPQRKIQAIELIAAQSAHRFVTMLYADNGSARYVLYDGGATFDLTPPEVLASKRWTFKLVEGQFLAGGARARYFFRGDSIVEKKSGAPSGTNFFLFDETAVRWIALKSDTSFSNLELIQTILEGDPSGILVTILGGLPLKGNLRGKLPVSYCDPSNPGAGFQKPPDLTVENGPAISLGAVVGSPETGTAVAELPDSIVLLRRAH